MAESTDAHNKLQSNLSKTMQEIYDQEKHIAQLKKSIRDKECPLKVPTQLSNNAMQGVKFSNY